MTNSTTQANTSQSNALGGLGDALSNAFSGLSSGFSNMFSGGGGNNFIADPTGMSGSDVSGLFNNLSSDAFNLDTGTAQATQAITPPAQAQAAAASGTDPAAPIGGVQSQTASTGPAPQQPPSQEQQNQEQRNKAIDELRRLLEQRNKNKPWQYPPRQIAAFQAQPGIGRGPAGVEAGLYSPNISPDAAVRAGLLAPEMIDPTTGTIRRTPPPAAPAAPEKSPALPDPSGRTSSGQVVPAGEEGRQITVQPRAPLPARTVPGTPGAAPGTDVAPGTAPETFTAGEPMVNEPWYTNQGTFNIPGLPGVGALPGWMLRGAALGAAGAALSPTPAETGEFTPAEPNFVRPDAPIGTRGPPAPPPPAPPPKSNLGRKPKKSDPPPRREAPREVWVPPTPGHYIPTTGLGRGPGTLVPGTPGHYERVAGQGRPPAAVSPAAAPRHRTPPEAAPEPSLANGGLMAYSEQGMSPMLRDVLGINLPTMLMALASDDASSRPSRQAQNVSWEAPAAAGGGFRLPGRRVGPLPQPRQGIDAASRMSDPSGFAQVQQNITRLESGGNYSAVGPVTRTGDRAYGKYQVMGANVGPWTREVLGREMSPAEFRANPQAQEAVFRAKMEQYHQQFGNWRDAASMWFTGRPYAQGRSLSDRHMTGEQYVGQATAGVQGAPAPAPVQAAGGDAQI